MTRIAALCLATALAVTPVSAQDTDGDGSITEGFDLFSEGTRMILEGLVEEMRPMLEEAAPLLREEVAPILQGLAELVDDLAMYELPERLPNGDIIIRRRLDAPPVPETGDMGETGEVEL